MKKQLIIWTDADLSTREKRRAYEKENPDKRLCFELKHPDFPLFISIISLLLVVCKPILLYMLQ
jgi:hypothetical protein